MSPWYRFCRAVVHRTARLLWGLRVEGRENVPEAGALLVACNHVSLLDPPIVGSSLPREAGFVAKQELFAVPGLGRLIRSLNAIPIDRSRLSRETLEQLVAFLDEGRALVLFPEGTRSRNGRLGSAKPGVGLLLLRRPAAVMPAWVEGTDAPWRNLFRRGRMRVTFGRPHALPQDVASSPGRGPEARRIADWILDEIRRLSGSVADEGDGSPGDAGSESELSPRGLRGPNSQGKGWNPEQ